MDSTKMLYFSIPLDFKSVGCLHWITETPCLLTNLHTNKILALTIVLLKFFLIVWLTAYLNFIQILSRCYPNSIQILSRFFLESHFILILSRSHPDFIKIFDKILTKCFFHLYSDFIQLLSNFYQNFIWILFGLYLDFIWIKFG